MDVFHYIIVFGLFTIMMSCQIDSKFPIRMMNHFVKPWEPLGEKLTLTIPRHK